MALRLSLAGPASVALAGDFWNAKDPSAWTEKDRARLLNKSPWAREAVIPPRLGPPAGSEAGGTPNAAGGRGEGPGGPPYSAPGGGATAPRGGGPEAEGSEQQLTALVRWESAAPIREAARTAIPPEAGQYYIISVRGLPVPPSTGEARLKQATRLERKGKDPIHPERVQTARGNGQTGAVFLFPRAPQPITLDDKEVVFVSGAGALPLKAKFPLKDMIYRGQLAL